MTNDEAIKECIGEIKTLYYDDMTSRKLSSILKRLIKRTQQQWKTIDTATKDGTRILLGRMSDNGMWIVTSAHFGAQYDCETKEGFEYLKPDDMSNFETDPHNESTHWMPLYEPPKKDT